MNNIGNNIGNTVRSTARSVRSLGKSVGSKLSESATAAVSSVSKTTTKKQSWNTVAIVAIVIVLAILGFNLFTYLAKGTDLVTQLLDKMYRLVKWVVSLFGAGTKKTVNLAKKGSKDIAKIAEVDTSDKKKDVKEKDIDKTLNKKKKVEEEQMVEPTSSDVSKIQSAHKQGWCYIGTDRGYRSCLEIGKDDVCMSGKIFQTEQQCQQPQLRYE